MDRASRTRAIILVVLLLVSIPLVVVVVTSGGADEEEPQQAGLRVEPAQGAPEIVVYVEDPKLNVLETTGGAKEVEVECVDGAGAVLLTERQPWPFTDTDNGLFDPHAHVFVEPALMRRIARCRLAGTEPPLEGRKA